MSTQRPTSMASVWDTLNAMKARREAAETSTKTLRHDVAKKNAYDIFENHINRLVTERSETNTTSPPGDEDISALVTAFLTDCQRQEDVATLMTEYRKESERDPLAQVSSARRMVDEAVQNVSVARHALRKAERLSNGLAGFVTE